MSAGVHFRGANNDYNKGGSMKRILFVFTSLAFFTVPAAAVPVSLPALQAQVESLQAQVNAMAAGDGTAEAMAGTWTGEHNSLVVNRAVNRSSPSAPFTNEPFFHVFGYLNGGIDVGLGPGNFDTLQPFFHTQIMAQEQCASIPLAGGGTAVVNCFVPKGMFTVGINPNFFVAKGERGPMTLTLTHNGRSLSGCAAAACPDASAAGLRGAVVGNNFVALRMFSPQAGACGNAIFQGTASLSLDRTRMTFSGAGIDSDCSHVIFSLNLRKS